MPIYEYLCTPCGRVVSLLIRKYVWLSVPVVEKLTSSALFLPQAYQAEKIAFQNQENHLMIPTY